jgi:serine protease Do
MEPNDYKNNESGTGQYTYRYGADQQPGGYYYNPYNPYGAPGGKPPERRGLRRALVAIIMVLCLIVGCALGVYLIPNINGNGQQSTAMTAPTATSPDVQPSEQTAITPDDSLTTDNPQIGGDKPVISESDSPVVQIVEAVSPSVVVVRIDDPSTTDEYDPQGTGIIVSSDGYIVTNYHVISEGGSFDIIVKTSEDVEYEATPVGYDETTDLAVIKIKADKLTAFAPGNSDDLQVGEEVVAIGNALGMGSGTVTTGIISGLNKQVTNENYYTQEYIQTDAAINPGNSGGPLINMQGEVVGINTLKSFIAEYDQYGQAVSSEGIGFAIPINTALPIINQLITVGSVVHPGIGVKVQAVEADAVEAGSPAGLAVMYISEDSPAAIAGIQVGDIIIKADGNDIISIEELREAIDGHQIGEEMSLTVWRSGEERPVSVTVQDTNLMKWE